MEGVGFRTLIIFFLLAILAFIAGSLASENATQALIPAGLILGGFFLLYLGKNCWILLFLLPPVCSVLNITLADIPPAYIISGVVVVYMIILSMLGYTTIKWNSLPGLDILTLLLCGHVMVTWFKHPVTINAFTSITDFGYQDVGGASYVMCITATLFYITVSIIKTDLDFLMKILKWTFYLALAASVIACAKGLISGSTQIGEEISNTRFGAFAPVAKNLFLFITSKYTILGILISPWKLGIFLCSLAGVAFSGFRTSILQLALFTFYVSIWKKQLLLVLFLGLLSWGALVYLSHEEKLDGLPYGVARILSSVPGVDPPNAKAAHEAQGSIEWRTEMWKWALDPSKGHIKDYVWGDGPSQSQYKRKLAEVAIGLGLKKGGDNEFFADMKTWHNTIISIIQDFGLVGLGIVISWLLYACYVIIRILSASSRLKGREYVYITFIPLLGITTYLPVATGTSRNFFTLFCIPSIAKLMFVIMKEEGYIKPLFKRDVYIPKILEHEPAAVKRIQSL